MNLNSGLILLMRPKHWIKNAFVFAPLIFSSSFFSYEEVYLSFVAFMMFSITASSVYIINDLLDFDKDRNHPQKKNIRPLASGRVSKKEAIFLLISLIMTLLFLLPIYSVIALPILSYFVINIAYSLKLKNTPILDIFTISVGFVIRVYTGAVAIGVELSPIMATTTFFLALYLASIKRRQELVFVGDLSRPVLMSYTPDLMDRYVAISATSALLSYCMFIMNELPNLWVSVLFVVFGLFRYWLLADTLDKGESPTDVLYSDKQLQLCITSWILVCIYGACF